MAISLATNSSNDLYLTDQKNLATVTSIQAVLQDAEHAMKTLLEEMVLASDRGMPYFQTVWNDLDVVQFTGYARTTILNVPGTVEILSFEAVQDNEVLNYRAVIQTVYGQGVING